MWIVACVVAAVASTVATAGAPAPSCGADCIQNFISQGENNYTIDGKSITIRSDIKLFSLLCNNVEIEYDKLPHFNASTTFEKVTFTNCPYSSMTLAKVMKSMNISSNHLVLEDWKTTQLEPFTDLEGLTALEVVNHKLMYTSFSDISSLTNLTLLNFTNGILTLKSDVQLSTQIKWLDLSKDELETLPDNLLHNLSLKSLVMSNNKLYTLPANLLVNQTILNLLDLSDNRLTEIPADYFSSLTSLEELYLQDNSIHGLFLKSFTTLKSLKILNLDDNLIESLPDGVFLHLSRLEVLGLRGNMLSSVSQDVFPAPRVMLRDLDLSHNNLADLCPRGESALRPLESLRYLRLDHNRLTGVCRSWRMLRRLMLLDLRHNALDNLSRNDFEFFSGEPLTVDYRDNDIDMISFDEYRGETDSDETGRLDLRTARFLIDGNPFLCDAYMYGFIRTVRERRLWGERGVLGGRCSTGGALGGRALADVDPEELAVRIVDVCVPNCTCEYKKRIRQFAIGCDGVRGADVGGFRTREHMDRVVVRAERVGLVGLTGLPVNITELHAAHNRITDLPPLPDTLKVLDVSDNRISRVSPAVAERLLADPERRLLIAGNPLACDCGNRHLLLAILAHADRVLDGDGVTCDNGTAVTALRPEGLCGGAWGALAGGLLAGGAALAAVVLCGLLCYGYGYEIKVYLYSRGWLPTLFLEPEPDRDRKYDAFVSYSHLDSLFVVEELIPHLEGERGYRLCVHHRDWIPGDDIPTQILRSVEDSRRTIVVVSENFLRSMWARAEFRAAAGDAGRSGLPRVIAVLLGDLGPEVAADPALAAYLSVYTYLRRDDPRFWEKLRFALPHRSPHRSPRGRREEEKRRERLRPVLESIQCDLTRLGPSDPKLKTIMSGLELIPDGKGVTDIAKGVTDIAKGVTDIAKGVILRVPEDGRDYEIKAEPRPHNGNGNIP